MHPATLAPSPDLAAIRQDPHGWLRRLLFGGATGAGSDYRVLSTDGQPRLVVPVDRRAAGRGVIASSGGSGAIQRGVRAVAATAAAVGGAHLARGAPLTGPADGGLLAVLRDLEPRTATMTVRLGSLRPNLKPVVVLQDVAGHAVGFAKIGWNDATRDLVAHESRVLEAVAGSGAGVVTAPALRGTATWNGLAIVVQEALRVPPLRRSRLTDAFAARAIADLAGAADGPVDLATSAYGTGLVHRAAAIEDPVDRRTAARLVDAARVRHGGSTVRLGRWHGDLTPWNLARIGDRLLVWDWERSSTPVPLGLDALHFHTPPVALADGDTDRVLASARARATRWLRPLGVRAADVEVLQVVHLVELLLRHRLDGHAVDTPHRRALLAAVESWLARHLEV